MSTKAVDFVIRRAHFLKRLAQRRGLIFSHLECASDKVLVVDEVTPAANGYFVSFSKCTGCFAPTFRDCPVLDHVVCWRTDKPSPGDKVVNKGLLRTVHEAIS